MKKKNPTFLTFSNFSGWPGTLLLTYFNYFGFSALYASHWKCKTCGVSHKATLKVAYFWGYFGGDPKSHFLVTFEPLLRPLLTFRGFGDSRRSAASQPKTQRYSIVSSFPTSLHFCTSLHISPHLLWLSCSFSYGAVKPADCPSICQGVDMGKPCKM